MRQIFAIKALKSFTMSFLVGSFTNSHLQSSFLNWLFLAEWLWDVSLIYNVGVQLEQQA